MLTLYTPIIKELWFRQRILEDADTMSYNHVWGGTIPFPPENWQPWHDRWIAHPEGKRFYRYLKEEASGAFVGEVAYHWDDDHQKYLADVIVYAPYRGAGYGREGLRLLVRAAVENGVEVLYDDIAADNPAIGLFLSEGFEIESGNELTTMMKKRHVE